MCLVFIMYDKILLPTDGSKMMAEVLESAINLANKYNSELHTLYVVDTRYADLVTGESGLEVFKEEAEKAVTEIEDKAKKNGIEVVKEISEGVPSSEIIDYADENKIDLIIMGTHGKTGISDYLLGSVAEKVLRHSKVPILLTR